MQYIYEFSAFCTSSVVKLQNGTIAHDRNLDFAFAPPMRNITFEARFYRGDQLIYIAPMFAGYNGILTGMRPGAFSISINERTPTGHSNLLKWFLNVGLLIQGYAKSSQLIRDTLETCTNYDCAFN